MSGRGLATPYTLPGVLAASVPLMGYVFLLPNLGAARPVALKSRLPPAIHLQLTHILDVVCCACWPQNYVGFSGVYEHLLAWLCFGAIHLGGIMSGYARSDFWRIEIETVALIFLTVGALVGTVGAVSAQYGGGPPTVPTSAPTVRKKSALPFSSQSSRSQKQHITKTMILPDEDGTKTKPSQWPVQTPLHPAVAGFGADVRDDNVQHGLVANKIAAAMAFQSDGESAEFGRERT